MPRLWGKQAFHLIVATSLLHHVILSPPHQGRGQTNTHTRSPQHPNDKIRVPWHHQPTEIEIEIERARERERERRHTRIHTRLRIEARDHSFSCEHFPPPTIYLGILAGLRTSGLLGGLLRKVVGGPLDHRVGRHAAPNHLLGVLLQNRRELIRDLWRR